jgi:hypothetical protein
MPQASIVPFLPNRYSVLPAFIFLHFSALQPAGNQRKSGTSHRPRGLNSGSKWHPSSILSHLGHCWLTGPE